MSGRLLVREKCESVCRAAHMKTSAKNPAMDTGARKTCNRGSVMANERIRALTSQSFPSHSYPVLASVQGCCGSKPGSRSLHMLMVVGVRYVVHHRVVDGRRGRG